ncbi:MAG: helix-turn-helix domain-containing protein [Pseudomonadota bacterium]
MSADEQVQIRIVTYRGAQLSSTYGLVDLFEKASAIGADQAGDAACRLNAGTLSAPYIGQGNPSDVLILPPSLTSQGSPDETDELLSTAILAHHEQGGLICSICAGAFHLARTGLLDGRNATTHWALADRLAEAHPDILLMPDKLIIDDGDIITVGGVMAWMDLGLRLIDRFLGSAIMSQTARFFLVDPAEREQRYYSGFIPRLTHGDASILKVQRWLQNHFAEKVSLPKLASIAGLGERTFIRRFQAATGLRPTSYVQSVRIAKAKELMELTTETVDAISWRTGYEDPSAFRRVFQKKVGLSPREYRQRFSLKPVAQSDEESPV